MRPPAISVAMCLYNRAAFVHDALDSALAQTFSDFEIVIIDDGSTDGGPASIRRRYGSDSRIKIVPQSHQGLTASRRASIAAASGEFVAFLDSDDLWEPHKLAAQLAVARADPDVALICSDCWMMDETGRRVGLISEQYNLQTIEVARMDVYAELLRRGCFVWQSTVMARTAALRAVDAYDLRYPYVADYDTWLRMARRARLHYMPEVLATWRMHPAQFTRRVPELTLADQDALLRPFYKTASVPPDVRVAIGDRMIGQHRLAVRTLVQRGRVLSASRAAAGMARYPRRAIGFLLGAIAESQPFGSALLRLYKAARRSVRRAPSLASARAVRKAVWIDGAVLGESRAGYFSLVTGLIRDLLARADCVVHVVTDSRGRRTLRHALGADARRIHIHAAAWSRVSGVMASGDEIEVLIWGGRFRRRGARRIAVLPDLTTKIHPELHTRKNLDDFDAMLEHAQRHAHEIATLSESSRRDIVARLRIYPDCVSIMPAPLHPVFDRPQFSSSTPRDYGLAGKYVLFVGCIEPRKNLRRLVRAFDLLKDEPELRGVTLAIAGPPGWDEGFERFVTESDAAARVRCIGFVPVDHLPSLYHGAEAVVYPSLYEGFGLPILEAMSSSAIVLASNLSSMPEVLGDGILFDPYRTDDIAAALLRALSMPAEEAVEYRSRCRRRAVDMVQRFRDMPVLPGLEGRTVVTIA